jgi:hypothetical protein
MGSSPFHVVLEEAYCPVNISRLFPFVAAAEKQYTNPVEHRVVDSIAGSPIYSQFANASLQVLAVAKVTGREPVDPGRNLRLGASISQARKPIIEYVFPSAADVVTNLNHISYCNL